MSESRLSGYTRRVLIAAGIFIGSVAGIFFLWQLGRVFLLLFGGVLLAVILSGFTDLMVRHTGLPRGVVMTGAVLGLIGSLVGFGFLVGPRLASQGSELAQRLPEAGEQLRQQIASQEWGKQLLDRIPLESGSNNLTGNLLGAFSTTASALTSALVVFIIGLYFAISPDLYVKGIAHLVPQDYRRRVGQVFGAMGHVLRWWMVGRLASMLVVGVLTGLGLFIAGVPLFLSLGVIAGLFSFVPYIGPIAAAIPAILVAFTVSPTKALYVVLIFVGAQLLESYLITPLIQKRTVSIPPAMLIGAQVVAGVLAGVLGVFLATPLVVTLTVAVQMLYVEDVLGDPMKVLGQAEEEALNERAGDKMK
jgi:predicted PurR-regulated permease PerM